MLYKAIMTNSTKVHMLSKLLHYSLLVLCKLDKLHFCIPGLCANCGPVIENGTKPGTMALEIVHPLELYR